MEAQRRISGESIGAEVVNPHFYSLEVCGMLPSSIASPAQVHVVRDWQAAHGLTSDGVIGPATADAMHLDALARGVKVPFVDEEFLQGAPLPADLLPALRQTIRMACVLRRDVFGGVPCEVLTGGGFRLRTKPRVAGQAKDSLHYQMRAADLRPTVKGAGTPVEQWRSLTGAAMADGRLVPGGWNVYTDKDEPFQHTDWRGYVQNGW